MTIVATIAGVNIVLMNCSELDASAISWCKNKAWEKYNNDAEKYDEQQVPYSFIKKEFTCPIRAYAGAPVIGCGAKYYGCEPIANCTSLDQECIPTKCLCQCK